MERSSISMVCCPASHVSCGQDLVVRAKTGAGKTMSFLLPSMDRFLIFSQDMAKTWPKKVTELDDLMDLFGFFDNRTS